MVYLIGNDTEYIDIEAENSHATAIQHHSAYSSSKFYFMKKIRD